MQIILQWASMEQDFEYAECEMPNGCYSSFSATAAVGADGAA